VQTVLAELLKAITPLLAPVAPHLAEDIWSHIPEAIKKSWHAEESVLLSEFPSPNSEFIDQQKEEFWSDLLNLRTIVNKALEQARSARSIGSSLEAQVRISIAQEVLAKKAETIAEQLPAFLITSQVELLSNGKENHSNGQTLSYIDEDGIQVAVLPANGKKCVRCWKYSTIVGTNTEHPELCEYCLVAIAS
jgi:isoleucyl-tRNA synthetase